ncbi:MAG: hypothetical protein OEM22_01600 [Acidimicrobiia bacterium]|nr:hypothetical protein [Acidimicrobiia bacterium]MDH3425341.1 hypothetical protein [Acidimicrobiia bacterium]MDH5615624.1 hypothetical protein [Acidimicrobiia bacterium]
MTVTVVVAIGMGMFGSVAGVLQRLLFVITYAWYGRELLTRTEVST